MDKEPINKIILMNEESLPETPHPPIQPGNAHHQFKAFSKRVNHDLNSVVWRIVLITLTMKTKARF